MKLVTILGNSAVGKMTVGQELAKITDLRLFHNHMTIEPVLEIFGRFDGRVIADIREAIFRNFAASDHYGLIFTYMMAFDHRHDWDYMEHVREIFAPYDTDFYYVELVAPQAIRLERNASENRLVQKASKRDLAASRARLLGDDEKYRCESLEGEIPWENYIKIDNSELSPEETARIIQDRFDL